MSDEFLGGLKRLSVLCGKQKQGKCQSLQELIMQMSRNNMSNYINSVQLKIDIPLHGSSLKEILDLF